MQYVEMTIFLGRQVKMSHKLQKRTALQNENEVFDKTARLTLLPF